MIGSQSKSSYPHQKRLKTGANQNLQQDLAKLPDHNERPIVRSIYWIQRKNIGFKCSCKQHLNLSNSEAGQQNQHWTETVSLYYSDANPISN